jgi:GxxExxY protein
VDAAMTIEAIPAETDQLARQAVDAAFKVHSALGPGLLESVYEACMCHELAKRGILFERQVRLPVKYDGVRLDAALRIDLIVAKRLIRSKQLNRRYRSTKRSYSRI